MKYKVSVVVPVYGVERFIERCARSLFEQTLDSIEYIFVDDCTKDDSVNILYKVIKCYPSRKNHVRILHHTVNKGLPQARKTGIQECHGEYIAHCDSDDWVSVNMYKAMYEYAIHHNYDIVHCDYIRHDGKDGKIIRQRNQPLLQQGPIWNKLVKANLYNKEIIYPTANKSEDGALSTQLYFFAERTGYLPQSLYFYFINPESMCRTLSKDDCIRRFSEECKNVELRAQFIYDHKVISTHLDSIISWKWSAKRNLWPYIKDEDIYSIWSEAYPEVNEYYKNNHIYNRARIIDWILRKRYFFIFNLLTKFRK